MQPVSSTEIPVSSSEQISSKKTGTRKAIFIIGTLFFMFGFITWLSSVLIPYLQIACELNNFESYLVAFAFYISYFVMSVPSSFLLRVIGFKHGISAGLLIVALGSLLFIPAALSRTYVIFLAGLFVQGTGLAVLQTASNPYMTILGPRESAAKRISIMGICNGVAGIIAPVILGAVVLKNADAVMDSLNHLNILEKEATLDALARKVIIPYIIIAVTLVLLAVFVYFLDLPAINEEEDNDGGAQQIATAKTSIFQFPHLLLGVLTLFLYTGVEVIAGNTIISYGAYLGISLSTAKYFTSLTLMGMLIGYIIGIICIPKYLSQEKALRTSAMLGIVLAIGALSTGGFVSILFIAMLGIANSLMWPSIWPLAINALGKFTKIASSFLVMAISGAAILPLVYGWLSDHFNAQAAYAILIPCYIVIGYYAKWGHKVGLKTLRK